ncbi:MAG: hypothetical protein ACKO4N_06540 [Verrucomicrobiota bacterium]
MKFTSMASSLPIYILRKHLFADTAEGRTLIDTGAPYTASRSGSLFWGGKIRKVHKGGYLGFDFDTLSANIGAQVDALVGLDLLSEEAMHFDLIAGRMELGVATPAEGSFEIDTSAMGMPVVNIRLNDHGAKAIFDTGAQYGYVMDAKFGHESFRTATFKDFHPIMGDLEPTDAWKLPFTLGEERVEDIFGLAPAVMKMSVGVFGFDAIFGPSWMPERSTWLDLKGGRMKVGPRK